MKPRTHLLLTPLLSLLLTGGCATRRHFATPRRPADAVLRMEVTGYCPCGICCGWRRSWFGLGPPVIASGPNKGQRKQVGITASGTRARPGTVAADTTLLPFGTLVHVPDYGWGRVEDRGGAIKGHKLDLYFKTHREAREWGRQHVEVRIWK